MSIHALVVGATGLVGRHVVQALSDQESVASVHCLVRESSAWVKQEKVTHHVVDFFNISQDLFLGITHVLCCVGTTIKQAGSRDQFQFVDHYIPKEVARLARLSGVPSFFLVSSMGANENSRWFYLRVKGAIENHLIDAGFESLAIYRPSLLAGKRKKTRVGEQLAIGFYATFGWLIPKRFKPTCANRLATIMIQHVMEPKVAGHRIFNADMLH